MDRVLIDQVVREVLGGVLETVSVQLREEPNQCLADVLFELSYDLRNEGKTTEPVILGFSEPQIRARKRRAKPRKYGEQFMNEIRSRLDRGEKQKDIAASLSISQPYLSKLIKERLS